MRVIRIREFLAKSVSIILTGYIFIMAVIYPLFMTRGGYVSVGNDKYHFFRVVTFTLLALAFVFWITGFWFNGKKAVRGLIGSRLSSTQWAAVLFVLLTTVSWFFSSYRAVAFSGSQGWFIGLETILLLIFSYLLIDFLWRYHENIWLCFLVGSGIAFILGILNRFSIYPIKFELMAPNFISTLGNINWVAGYFSVLWPIGAGLYLFGEKKYLRYAAGVYSVVAMGLGIVQGSESVFLSFAAVFFVLLVISLGQWEKYGRAYLEIVIGWCVVCQLVRLFRFIFPGRFNYAVDDISGFLTSTSFSIYLMLVIFIPYLLLKCKAGFPKKNRARFLGLADDMKGKFTQQLGFHTCRTKQTEVAVIIKRMVVIAPFALLLLFIFLVIANTITPNGILGLGGSSLFNYGDDWGNGRGAIWNLSIELFIRMSPAEKLIGVGADCFAEFLYGFSDLAALCRERFGSQVLRNAHSEILTAFINFGVLGTVAYFSIFTTFIVRFMKKGKRNAMLYVPALCVVSYLAHNVVSFGQILSLPFVFIVMGISEGGERKRLLWNTGNKFLI